MVCELRAFGFEVDAADLYEYEDPLIPNIATGVDVFDLKSGIVVNERAASLGRLHSERPSSAT
jgi:hypothetical protein